MKCTFLNFKYAKCSPHLTVSLIRKPSFSNKQLLFYRILKFHHFSKLPSLMVQIAHRSFSYENTFVRFAYYVFIFCDNVINILCDKNLTSDALNPNASPNLTLPICRYSHIDHGMNNTHFDHLSRTQVIIFIRLS